MTAPHRTAPHRTAPHRTRLAKFNTFLSITFLSLSCLTLPSLSAHAESNDSLMKKGMWKDPQTGLIWMRCSMGQEWNGSTCTGKPIELNWKDANAYFELFNEQVAFGGKRDWRLPSIEELSTIRKCSNGWARENTVTIGNLTKSTGNIEMRTIPTKSGGTKQVPKRCANGSNEPTIDTHIFPNMQDQYYYWSSSPVASYSYVAWSVSFSDGNDSYDYKRNNNYVRAVRSGN